MPPVDAAAPATSKVEYHSPVGEKVFDRVEVLAGAEVAVRTHAGRYAVEAAIPLKSIGLAAKPGLTIRGDVGVIASDAKGRTNTARTYWANPHTSLVSDLPLEAWLCPATWGELVFGK